MTTHKAIREALLIAAVNCPHDITEDRVTFYFNKAKPGNNALDQLMTRLESAAINKLLAYLDAKTAEVERLQALRPVAMTDEQIDSIADGISYPMPDRASIRQFARAVLAHHITQKERAHDC